MGNEVGEEIRGIADYWNIDVGIILGMNIIYEARKVRTAHSYLIMYKVIISCMYIYVGNVRKTTL